MNIKRYIRAYDKGSGDLAFERLLPDNSLTFLSTVDFLQNDDDPLLYYCYDLTTNWKVDFIWSHFFGKSIHDRECFDYQTEYFDYILECDSTHDNKVKTKETIYIP